MKTGDCQIIPAEPEFAVRRQITLRPQLPGPKISTKGWRHNGHREFRGRRPALPAAESSLAAQVRIQFRGGLKTFRRRASFRLRSRMTIRSRLRLILESPRCANAARLPQTKASLGARPHLAPTS